MRLAAPEAAPGFSIALTGHRRRALRTARISDSILRVTVTSLLGVSLPGPSACPDRVLEAVVSQFECRLCRVYRPLTATHANGGIAPEDPMGVWLATVAL